MTHIFRTLESILIHPFTYAEYLGGWKYTYTQSKLANDQSPSPLNDEFVTFRINVDRGTYTLRVSTHTHNAAGIMDIDLDGVEIHSVDLYSVSVVNPYIVEKTGIIMNSGIRTLKFRVDGKNTDSTGYDMAFYTIALIKTSV